MWPFNESYWAVLSCVAVYYAVQRGSNFWVSRLSPKVWPFKWKLLSSTFQWCCSSCCTLVVPKFESVKKYWSDTKWLTWKYFYLVQFLQNEIWYVANFSCLPLSNVCELTKIARPTRSRIKRLWKQKERNALFFVVCVGSAVPSQTPGYFVLVNIFNLMDVEF